nr:VOC family protein [Nakamurella flavida]
MTPVGRSETGSVETGSAVSGDQPAVAVELDHLVLATPTLSATVEDFHARTGVRPSPGGRHLGVGTRNYLVGLGAGHYLEIVGPDEERATDRPGVMPFGIDDLVAPRLATWSVRQADLDLATRAALSAGADLGPVRSMTRRANDGSVVQWRVAYPVPAPFDGVVPFVIDWGTSLHPASTELPEVSLVEVRGSHPQAAAVRRVLDALGVGLRLNQGPAGLEADLQTPRGLVTLR